MKILGSSLFIILSLYTAASHAEDRLNLDGTAIIGNQELPKVLYIVPWKKSEVPDMNQPPLESLIDEALQPIDREVFRRQVNYYHALHDKPESNKK